MIEIRPMEAESIEDIWGDLMSPSDGLPPRNSFFGRIALGNGTAYTIGMQWVDDDGEKVLLVSIIDKGACTFRKFVHFTYAMEKLNLLIWDAQNLADFINRQLGLTGIPQGRYMKACARTPGGA